MAEPVEMRPRMIWRLAAPIAAIGWLGVAADERAWVRFGIFAVFLGFGACAWRAYARNEDGVVFERGVLRWYPPLLLDEVTEVTLHFQTWGKDLPHRELWLSTKRGTRILSLRWWHDWRPFVSSITEHLTEVAAGGRRWRVATDEKTSRRLLDILAEHS